MLGTTGEENDIAPRQDTVILLPCTTSVNLTFYAIISPREMQQNRRCSFISWFPHGRNPQPPQNPLFVLRFYLCLHTETQSLSIYRNWMCSASNKHTQKKQSHYISRVRRHSVMQEYNLTPRHKVTSSFACHVTKRSTKKKTTHFVLFLQVHDDRVGQ